MHVRHTVAAALVAILLIQSAGLAQPEDIVRSIPREEAIQVLVGNLDWGTEIRVEVAGGRQVVGRYVERNGDDLVIAVSGQRQTIALRDVTTIRRPLAPGRITDAGAFGIGAAAGVGLLFGVLFLGVFAH
jgi:hypothetical protein